MTDRRLGLLVLVALTISWAWPSPADAHRRILGTYSVQVDGAHADWTLRIDAVDVGRLMQADANGDEEFAESELLAVREPLVTYLRERLWLSTDGVSCGPPSVAAMQGDDDIPHWLDITGTFDCPQPMGIVEVGNRVLIDFIGEYQHFIEFETPVGIVNRLLNRGRPSIRIRVADPQPPPSGEAAVADGADDRDIALPTGALGRIGLFIKEGIRHIFIGPDHILFILGLTIAAMSLRRLALIVTSFTIAHSITLALASLDILRLDINLAEALIALSVAYVGLENVLRQPKHRAALAFAFGLVHGVGFSSVLGDLVSITSMDRGARIQLLFGFNVGVEIGQLTIVCAVYPIMIALRKVNWQRRFVILASVGILAVGGYWFVERATAMLA